MDKRARLESYINEQGINASRQNVLPTFYDPKAQAGESVPVFPYATIANERVNLDVLDAEAMSLASMLAVLNLNTQPKDRVLDTCAAPGMKGMYLHALTSEIDYCANDISHTRLGRLKRLFNTHGIFPEAITHHDASRLTDLYQESSFDRIIIDAPCSGEGVIMAGDDKLLDVWSPAKVRRLQQIQIKILKNAWRLLKPGGRLVYATCTLNKNENERVIKKALKLDVIVDTASLDTHTAQIVQPLHALRILPSAHSIGFFIAVLEKHEEELQHYTNV